MYRYIYIYYSINIIYNMVIIHNNSTLFVGDFNDSLAIYP